MKNGRRDPHFVHVPDGSIVALTLNDADMAFVRDSGAKLRARAELAERRLAALHDAVHAYVWAENAPCITSPDCGSCPGCNLRRALGEAER